MSFAIRSGASFRSWMSSAVTIMTIGVPPASTIWWRLRPFTLFPVSWLEGPPLSVVLTDWLSIKAVVGSGERPHTGARGSEDCLGCARETAAPPLAEMVLDGAERWISKG